MINERVIKSAHEWIGTPYVHQHTTKGVGCDCLGMVRGVWRDVIGPEPRKAPNYSSRWDEVDTQEVLLNTAKELFIETDQLVPGCVIVFRMRARYVAKHCGILVSRDKMIHAYQGHSVEKTQFGDFWQSRIAFIGLFPQEV